MSVLIRGMEMPKMCSRCPLRYVAYLGVSICQVTNKRLEITRERPNDCPLIEVPTQHGRLIDADKLMRDIEKYHLSDGKFQHWVEVQQTIIEAEGSEA